MLSKVKVESWKEKKEKWMSTHDRAKKIKNEIEYDTYMGMREDRANRKKW